MDKIQLNFSEYSYLPEHIIVDAIDNRWETSLSYFLILRKIYKTPKFYSFTYRKLSRQTGISPAVLNRHVKRLISKGLMYIHSGNLCLTGLNKLKKHKYEKLVPIKTGADKKSTILNIQFTRIIRNFRKQQKVVGVMSSIILMHKSNFTPFEETKRLLRASKKLFNGVPTEKAVNDYYTMSNKKFGQLSNRGKSTGYLLQKRMNDAELIHSQRNSELFSKEVFNKRSFYEMCLPSCYVHSKQGLIYKVLPNKITVCTK